MWWSCFFCVLYYSCVFCIVSFVFCVGFTSGVGWGSVRGYLFSSSLSKIIFSLSWC